MKKDGFTGNRVRREALRSQHPRIATKTPAQFSREALNQEFFANDLSEKLEKFVEKYVRATSAYSADFTRVNVVDKSRVDMFDVPDEIAVYEVTKTVIESRFLAFSQGDPNWAAVEPIYNSTQLIEEEKTIDGWVTAFSETLDAGALSEKSRRENLNKFWALVDYSPNLNSSLVPKMLIKSFRTDADSSVQESVLNALREIEFSLALKVIISDAPRLHAEGRWLESLLGLWGDSIPDKDVQEFERQLISSSDTAKKALRLACADGLRNRARWALIADVALNQ
jgi:hypothetical protein